MCALSAVVSLTLLTEPTPEPTNLTLDLPAQALDAIERDHGPEARKRVEDWQTLIAALKNVDERQKLQAVNDFFNRTARFVDDSILWHTDDYWATPVELLYRGAGDCEDFSIAKYFTLRELGVDDDKLRITYVKALSLNQAHMVLTYYQHPNAEPWVLDNLIPDIQPAGARQDLQPVYSFNASGLWLAKIKGSGGRVATAEGLNPWADLRRRLYQSHQAR